MTRTALTILLLLSALGLLACKSDSLDGQTLTAQEPEAPAVKPTSFRVQGRVAAPVIAGARVAVYPVTDNGVDWQREIGRSSTNASGGFYVNLDLEYLNTTAVLVVQDRPGETFLECILLTGCGVDAEYGGYYGINDSLQLRVGVSALSAGTVYNATLLTELAFALAEAESKTVDTDFRKLVMESNHRIASRFGIIGALPSRPIANIADMGELSGISNETIKYSAMAPAIIAAVVARYPQQSVPQAMQQFLGQYLITGVPNNSRISRVISFAGIYEHLLPLLAPYEQRLDLAVLLGEISALKVLAQNDEDNRFDKGTVSNVLGMSPTARAKAFVKQVRQVASSIDLNKIGSLGSLTSFVDGNALGALEAFGVEVRMDELTSSGEMDVVTEAFKRTLFAALHILGEYYSGRTVISPYDGVHFSFTSQGDYKQILFNGSVDGCPERDDHCAVDTNLSLAGTFNRLTGNTDEQIVTARGIDVKLTGSLAFQDLTVELLNDKQTIVSGPLYYQKSDFSQGEWQHEDHSFELEGLRFNMPFKIAHAGDSGRMTLNGMLGLTLNTAKGSYLSRRKSEVENGQERVTEESQAVVDELHGVNLELGALLDNLQDDTFVAAVNIKQSVQPQDTIMYVKKSSRLCPLAAVADCEAVESHSGFEGETETSYLGLTLSTTFKANLKGISEPVLIGLSGSRLGGELNKLNHLKVTYPGHALVLDADFNGSGGVSRLDAVNLEGMQMKIDTRSTGVRHGSVTDFEGKSLADIRDMGEWIKISFADGFFESM